MSWRRVALGYLVRFGNGQDAKDVVDPEGENPVYGSGGQFATTNSYLRDGESILFGRKGTIDRPRYVEGKFWTIDTAYYAVSLGQADTKFLYYWATTIPFDTLMTNTARPSMTSADLSRLPVNLPPLSTQRRIADYLDRETTEMEAIRAELDELTIQLAMRIEALRDVHLGNEHPRVNLALLSKRIATGPFGTQVGVKDYVEGGAPLINPTHIQGNAIVPDPRVSVDEKKAEELNRHRLEAGDVVVARRGELGRCAVVGAAEVGSLTGTGSLRLTPRKDLLDPQFASIVISSRESRALLGSYSVGSTMDNLNESLLGRLAVPVPPLDQQRRIVESLDEGVARITTMIEDARKLQGLIAERRSALITEVVTGRKEV